VSIEQNVLSDIAGKLGRLESSTEAQARATTELTNNVNRLVERLAQSDKDATRAKESAASAHHRLTEINADIEKIRVHYDNEIRLMHARIEAETSALGSRISAENKERKADRNWLIGTVLTAAGLIIAIIKLF